MRSTFLLHAFEIEALFLTAKYLRIVLCLNSYY